MAFYQTIRGSAVTIPTPRETGWGQNVDNAISYVIDAINTGTVGVSIGGNTLGTKTLVSSGAAILMGGNNITLSQSGQNITIMGAAAGTGGGISGVSAGTEIATSGTVSFANSNGISFGLSSQTLTAAYSQSTAPSAIIISGTTSGATTSITSGTMVLMGGSNITLSQNGQSVEIVGASGGGGNLTISAGVASMSSGSLVFSNSNSVSFGLNGSTITANFSQSTHAHSAETFVGGVAAAGGTATAGTVLFSNSNGLAFGYNNSTITGSYSQSTHDHITYLGGVAAGGATLTSGTLVLSNSNGLAFSLNGSTITGSYTQSTAPAAVIIGSNTSGATASVSSGTLMLAGGNNITLSQNGQSITISGANIGGAQTGISGIGVSNTTYASGTVIFSAQANVTLGSSLDGSSQYVRISAGGGGGNLTISASNTTMSSGSLVFSNSNGLAFGLNGSTITGSYSQSTHSHGGISVSGTNTSGALTLVSSGTLYLAGGNNLTISQDGQSLTFSAGAGGGAFTGGMSTLGNTYGTTGLVQSRLVLVGSDNISLSQSVNGQSATLSIIGGAGGAGYTGGMSTEGNTAGTTGLVTGRLVIVGSNNITLSQSVNGGSASLSILAPSLSSLTGGNLMSVGTNGSTISVINLLTTSNTAYPVAADNSSGSLSSRYAMADHQHAGLVAGGVSQGNVSGDASGSRYGHLMLAGGNNITLSISSATSGQTITISGPNAGGAQTGISGIADSASTVTVGTVHFGNGGNISFGLNSVTMTASFSQSTHSHSTSPAALIIASNTSGATTSITSGTVCLAGGNNITLSQNGQSITISGPNVGGAQTGISGIADSASTVTAGTVVFGNGGNVSFGLNSVTMTASFSQSTHTHTVYVGGISVPNTAYTSGTVVFTGSGNITVTSSANNQTVIISGSQSVQTQSTFSMHGTSGSVTLVGGNLISISNDASTISIINLLTSSSIAQPVSSVGSAGTLASRYALADHAHAGVFSMGVSNLASSAGNTWVGPGRFVIRGSNNITASMSTEAGSLATIVLSGADTHAVQTFVSGVGAAGGTATSGNVIFSNSNNVSFGYNAGTITASATVAASDLSAGASNLGNASGTTGLVYNRLVFVGSDNITLSQSTNGQSATLSIIGGAGAGAFSGGMSQEGNTYGTTGLVQSRLVLVGSNNISLSQSVNGQSATLSIIGGAGAAGLSAGMSTEGNTAGSTGVVTGRLVVVGSGVISLSQSTNGGSASLSIVGPAYSTISAGNNVSISTQGSTISVINLLSTTNTVYDIGTVSNSGTLSSRFAMGDHVHQGIVVAGVSTGGNTSGNTGTKYGSVVLAGGNQIVLSVGTAAGGQTITVSLSSGPTVNRINAAFIATTLSANNQSIELSQGFNWYVHLSANATVTGMGNPRDGERYFFWISNRTNNSSLSFPAAVKWRNASAYVPTPTAGAIDAICMMYNSAAASYIAEHASSFA